jgi:hypothetical protein
VRHGRGGFVGSADDEGGRGSGAGLAVILAKVRASDLRVNARMRAADPF